MSANNKFDKAPAGIDHQAECEAPNNLQANESLISSNIKYTAVGIMFGIVFVKAEIISWYRIQEMFRLHSFHMYGVIGTAVLVGMLSIWIIKQFKIKTIQGETVIFQDKKFTWGNVIGATMFGLGWAITGACPGPLFAQIGSGFLVVIVTLLSAVAGTWLYGLVRKKLPH
jgi:uncharacterized membrane protein YedE/YeeE